MKKMILALFISSSLFAVDLIKLQFLEIEVNHTYSNGKTETLVIQREVDATDNPTDVRAMVQNLYATESELKSVFILGHVPIAYSGDIFPDTHFELRGAYPADCFYGEIFAVVC